MRYESLATIPRAGCWVDFGRLHDSGYTSFRICLMAPKGTLAVITVPDSELPAWREMFDRAIHEAVSGGPAVKAAPVELKGVLP